MHHLRDIQERLTKARQQQEADRYKAQKHYESAERAINTIWNAVEDAIINNRVIYIPPAHVHRDEP